MGHPKETLAQADNRLHRLSEAAKIKGLRGG
jgi:hypothetical protein